MENLLINNIFTGSKGSMNMFLSDQQSAFQEKDSKSFLSVLNKTMNPCCLNENGIGVEKGAATQQSCMQDIYPLLLGLLQNISNTNTQTGKDSGVADGDLSQQQIYGNDDNKTVEVDQTGMDATYTAAVMLLLNGISGMLSKEGINLDIKDIIQKIAVKNTPVDMKAEGNFSCNDIAISGENRIDNIKQEKDGQCLSGGLPEIKQNGESDSQTSQQPIEKTEIMPVINNIFFNQGYSFQNPVAEQNPWIVLESKDKVPAEYLMPGESYPVSTITTAQQPQNNIDNDIRNNIEVLVRNITDAIKQTKSSNKESFFPVHQQTVLDSGNAGTGKDGIQVFFADGDRSIKKSIITQEIDAVNPQNKDSKILSKENDYLPFSKQDHFEETVVQRTQENNGPKGTQFASVMTEKIEKIVEQYSAKGPSMDMIVRLKINDKDTLLVGLKNDGQRVMVDIKTANEGIMNILQTQKDYISRNLEEKNIYTNIFVDPDGNGSFDRREARRENQRNSKEAAKQKDFIEVLGTV